MKTKHISSILIANRGEIACRVIRSCKKMGIRSIAVYSEADRNAQHVKLADAAIFIGAAAATQSYLDISKVIQAAKDSDADAIHPGYGFLSENANFARELEKNNIIFIGPPADVLELMASKAAAKIAMEKAQVACVPGYHEACQDEDTLVKAAAEVGYPLLIKASAGGGGKGMRIARESADFIEALAATRREAMRAFGDDQVILERYIERPRHIEVQVFADQQGNVVHLFERDCSSQRRYQKVIEEAPAPNLDEDIRNAMYKAAVAATAAVNYSGAGTIEFILSEDGEFWFMEMNTRLQVEHPVTEMLTGIDLVEWQIMVASGAALPLKQTAIQAQGHAIEARLYAEDPGQDFLPAAGVISKLLQPPQDQSTRFDSGVISGDRISVHYDPMIAKLCVHAKDRNTAIAYLKDALAACWVDGISNNLDFLQRLLLSAPFTSGSMHTAWIDQHLAELLEPKDLNRELTIAAAGLFLQQQLEADKLPTSPWNTTDSWRIGAKSSQHILLQHKDQIFEFSSQGSTGKFVIQSTAEQAETAVECQLLKLNKNGFQFSLSIGKQYFERTMYCNHNHYCLVATGSRLSFNQLKWQASAQMQLMANTTIVAPMPGNIIEIKVQAGDSVNQGDVLVIMEAMKMELSLRAEVTAVVKSVIEQSSGFVDADTLLLELETENS